MTLVLIIFFPWNIRKCFTEKSAATEIDSLVSILSIEHSVWEYFSYWWLSDHILFALYFEYRMT